MANKTILILGVAAASVLTFSLTNCRQASGPGAGNAASQGPASPGINLLDSTTSSGISNGQCGTTYTSTAGLPAYLAAINQAGVITAPDAASRLAVLSALSAVPKSLLQLFFATAGGQIVAGDSATLCKDTPLTTQERALFGSGATIPACWHAPDNHQPLQLIVSTDPQTIRYTMLRLFAYVEAEYFVPRLLEPTIPAPFNSSAWQGFAASFGSTRTHLADAFLADLAAAGSPSLGALTQHNNTDPTSFGNFIYANAVDSYYCSSASQASFSSTLKATYKVFTDPTNTYAPLAVLGN